MKSCVDCGSAIPNPRRRRCDSCRRAVYTQHQRNFRARRHVELQDKRLRGTYGIELNDVLEQIACQDGLCAICETVLLSYPGPRGAKTAPNVDHDHVTGKVRGILCRACNVGIGNLRDDPSLLQRAIKYLI